MSNNSSHSLPRINPNRVPRGPSRRPIPFDVQVEVVNEYNEGYSMRAVAKKHGIAPSTVSRIIARALAQEEEEKKNQKN